jgi:Tfp pilus assembly protein PilF
LGWIYFKKDLVSQAVPLLREGVERDAGNPIHRFHLAMAYMRQGDWTKARQHFEEALKLRSDFEGADEARKALATIHG